MSGNARGRPRGSRNRRTRALIEAAEAGGETPLQYMLRVMRNPRADDKRRDAMAAAAAPYLHAKLSPLEPKPIPDPAKPETNKIEVRFIRPDYDGSDDDE